MSGEYARRLYLASADILLLGAGLSDVLVLHDDWCGSFKMRPCNCDPDMTLTTSSGSKYSIDRRGKLRMLSGGRLGR